MKKRSFEAKHLNGVFNAIVNKNHMFIHFAFHFSRSKEQNACLG